MVAEVVSGMVQGIQGELITVQTDISDGLPVFYMIGHLSAEVKEAKERVRTALKNTGFHLPPKRVSVNLAPADIRKNGTYFDLAIAVGLFTAMGIIAADTYEGVIFLGELALDGTLSSLNGVLSILKTAVESGYGKCIVPSDNMEEASLLSGLEVVACRDLNSVLTYLTGTGEVSDGIEISSADEEICLDGENGSSTQEMIIEKENGFTTQESTIEQENDSLDSEIVLGKDVIFPQVNIGGGIGTLSVESTSLEKESEKVDLSDIKGQEMAKRALEIAVAGYHNLFLDGPPGAGKSMLASCVPGIMPEMTRDEMIDTTMIYSVRGMLKKGFPLVEDRPFRAPSPSATVAGMFGGGNIPKPGEISLAHHGVLFLDEFPEFKRELIEMFRIPLEEHQITQVRNGKNVTFPADFIMIAAANPCPCGYYPDRKYCHCSNYQIANYQSKLSGPVLDRLDHFVRCDKLSYHTLTGDKKGEPSAAVRKRIRRVWDRQRERYGCSDVHFNGRMRQKEVEKYCALDRSSQTLMENIFETFRLTGRSYYKILKVGRTIADLEGSVNIKEEHLREALLFRRTSPVVRI
ncbi:MAG: YifB family Mg chelatase-like AAA ATPase [Clostridiales bacterium]|nr:YifB family Mg chelatase-like AAA ATPase [Clostridiales bacterium]